MAYSTTTCPFCNALVPLPDPVPARVLCRHCAESFVPRHEESATPAALTVTLEQEVERHRESRRGTGSSGWKWVAGLVLLAGIGAGIWWWQRPQKMPAPLPAPETAKIYTPEEMPALRYLPAGTDSIIAVQVQPLLGLNPTATEAEIRSALLLKGVPADFVEGLQKNVGLSWEQLDQLVIGTKLKNGLEVDRLVAVVHLRKPIDENEMNDAFAQISAELSQQYILSYYPDDTADKSGEFRTISLTVKGKLNVNLRTRKGYYVPKK